MHTDVPERFGSFTGPTQHRGVRQYVFGQTFRSDDPIKQDRERRARFGVHVRNNNEAGSSSWSSLHVPGSNGLTNGTPAALKSPRFLVAMAKHYGIATRN